MKSLTEIQKEQAERQAEYQKQKAMREATGGVAGKVALLKVLSGVKYAFQPVHKFENAPGFMYHMFNGDLLCSEICHEHYDGEVCPICGVVNSKGHKGFATATTFILGHVFNLVGKEFPGRNRTTGEPEIDPATGLVKMIKDKPLKLVAVPNGKKDCYISPFRAAAKRGSFMNEIFVIERNNGSGWEVPVSIDYDELKEIVGNVELSLPTEYSKYAAMDKRTLWKLILTAMPNARVLDLLGPDPAHKQLAGLAKVVDGADPVNPFAPTTTKIEDTSIDVAF